MTFPDCMRLLSQHFAGQHFSDKTENQHTYSCDFSLFQVDSKDAFCTNTDESRMTRKGKITERCFSIYFETLGALNKSRNWDNQLQNDVTAWVCKFRLCGDNARADRLEYLVQKLPSNDVIMCVSVLLFKLARESRTNISTDKNNTKDITWDLMISEKEVPQTSFLGDTISDTDETLIFNDEEEVKISGNEQRILPAPSWETPYAEQHSSTFSRYSLPSPFLTNMPHIFDTIYKQYQLEMQGSFNPTDKLGDILKRLNDLPMLNPLREFLLATFYDDQSNVNVWSFSLVYVLTVFEAFKSTSDDEMILKLVQFLKNTVNIEGYQSKSHSLLRKLARIILRQYIKNLKLSFEAILPNTPLNFLDPNIMNELEQSQSDDESFLIHFPWQNDTIIRGLCTPPKYFEVFDTSCFHVYKPKKEAQASFFIDRQLQWFSKIGNSFRFVAKYLHGFSQRLSKIDPKKDWNTQYLHELFIEEKSLVAVDETVEAQIQLWRANLLAQFEERQKLRDLNDTAKFKAKKATQKAYMSFLLTQIQEERLNRIREAASEEEKLSAQKEFDIFEKLEKEEMLKEFDELENNAIKRIKRAEWILKRLQKQKIEKLTKMYELEVIGETFIDLDVPQISSEVEVLEIVDIEKLPISAELKDTQLISIKEEDTVINTHEIVVEVEDHKELRTDALSNSTEFIVQKPQNVAENFYSVIYRLPDQTHPHIIASLWILLRRYKLRQELSYMADFCLLRSGMIRFFLLNLPVSHLWSIRHLNATLDDALRNYFDLSSGSDEYTAWKKNTFEPIMRRVSFTMPLHENETMSLQYTMNGPLSAIISSSTQEAYGQIFQLFLRIEEIGKMLVTPAIVISRRQQNPGLFDRKLIFIHRSCLKFYESLKYYLNEVAVGSTWEDFMAKISLLESQLTEFLSNGDTSSKSNEVFGLFSMDVGKLEEYHGSVIAQIAYRTFVHKQMSPVKKLLDNVLENLQLLGRLINEYALRQRRQVEVEFEILEVFEKFNSVAGMLNRVLRTVMERAHQSQANSNQPQYDIGRYVMMWMSMSAQ